MLIFRRTYIEQIVAATTENVTFSTTQSTSRLSLLRS